MITRTIYVPASAFGRNILTYIWERIGCSMGEIYKLDTVLRVPITLPQRDLPKLEKILQKFDLL
jgi:hypothetical protein